MSDAETLLRARVQYLSSKIDFISKSLSRFAAPRTLFSLIDTASSPCVWSWPPEHSSPRSEALSPQTLSVVGHAAGVIVHICSFASSIIFLRPTSQARICRVLDLWPSQTGGLWRVAGHPWNLLSEAGFRTKSLRTCFGSLTPRFRCTACVSAMYRIAFPTTSQGRKPELGDFGAQ
jgi:hypothetical protein